MTDESIKAERQQARPTEQRQGPPADSAGLQHRYGSIGIEAVAAAVRYSSAGRVPEPDAAPRIDQRFEQAV